jgi:hypothetical protein
VTDREKFFRLLAIALLGLGALALVPEGRVSASAVLEPKPAIGNAVLAADIAAALDADALNAAPIEKPYVIETGLRPAKSSKNPSLSQAENFDPEDLLKDMSEPGDD